MIFFVAATFVGCTKDDKPVEVEVPAPTPEPEPTPELSCRLIAFTSGQIPPAKIIYDEQGRVKEYILTWANNSRKYTNIFTYEKNTIKINYTFQEVDKDPVNEEYIYKIDDKGRITENSRREIKYYYNEDGYLVKYQDYHNYTHKLTYDNGNLIQIDFNTEETDKDYKDYKKLEYDLKEPNIPFFYTQIPNTILSGVFSNEEYILYDQGYFGKVSKNRTSKCTTWRSYNAEPDITDISYFKDDKGLITAISLINKTGSLGSVGTFECK